jgi:hypothetical protein
VSPEVLKLLLQFHAGLVVHGDAGTGHVKDAWDGIEAILIPIGGHSADSWSLAWLNQMIATRAYLLQLAYDWLKVMPLQNLRLVDLEESDARLVESQPALVEKCI